MPAGDVTQSAKHGLLQSLYQFYRSEDVLAWRTVGLAALIALELGWHLRTPHDDMLYNNTTRQHAIRLFWCIYIFDRRCSFNTGLPFAVNDSEIDPELPEPVSPAHLPSLLASTASKSAMLTRLCTEIVA